MYKSVQHIVERYIGFQHHIEQKTQHMYFCPLCNHKNPRLSVNYEKNMFRCWKCDWSGKSLVKILYDLSASYDDIVECKTILGESIEKQVIGKGDIVSIVAKNMFGNEKTNAPHIDQRKWETLDNNKIHLKFAKNYLYQRGLSDFEIEFYGIQYDSESGRLIFPSKDFSGRINYYVERTIGDGGFYKIPKGFKKTDVVFNEYFVDFKAPIIITEGVFDAYNIGYNAVPLLGTRVHKKLINYIKAFNTPKVIFFLDNDAYSKMIDTVTYLMKMGIPCSFVTTDSDAGATRREVIKEKIASAPNLHKLDLIEYNLYAQHSTHQ